MFHVKSLMAHGLLQKLLAHKVGRDAFRKGACDYVPGWIAIVVTAAGPFEVAGFKFL